MKDRLPSPHFLVLNRLNVVTGRDRFCFLKFLRVNRHFLSTVNTLAIPAIM